MLKSLRRAGPALLMLAPSLILVGVFVYGLIGANFQTSITDNHTAAQATGQKPSVVVWFENYVDLLGSEAFQHSLKNLVLYTVVFLAGTLVMGFLWAWMMDKPVKGEGLFRSVYLFPFAVSFVASGVVWRWLLNSNQDAQASGLNRLFQIIGLDFLQNNWWNNVTWGITAIAIPAIWQLSGYVMALFLAGFRGVPVELREAARMDGASEWKLYRHVIFPQLGPVALSALVIVSHMSLKVFDLIMSITKSIYQTEVPATYMWVTLTGNDYAKSATIATVLLVLASVFIVPYLNYTNRKEREGR